jgi:hypothetical protein
MVVLPEEKRRQMILNLKISTFAIEPLFVKGGEY